MKVEEFLKKWFYSAADNNYHEYLQYLDMYELTEEDLYFYIDDVYDDFEMMHILNIEYCEDYKEYRKKSKDELKKIMSEINTKMTIKFMTEKGYEMEAVLNRAYKDMHNLDLFNYGEFSNSGFYFIKEDIGE